MLRPYEDDQMTEETFIKAEKLMTKIGFQTRAVDRARDNKNASRLVINVVFSKEDGTEKEKMHSVEGALVHQIVDLIYSTELEKLEKLKCEFEKL